MLCADDAGASTLPVPNTAEVIRYGIDSEDARLRAVDIEPGNVLVPVRDYNTLTHLAAVVHEVHRRDIVVMTARVMKGPDAGSEGFDFVLESSAPVLLNPPESCWLLPSSVARAVARSHRRRPFRRPLHSLTARAAPL